MLPLHSTTNNSGGASASGGASGAHLVSTDEVISMLQQQHILQVELIYRMFHIGSRSIILETNVRVKYGFINYLKIAVREKIVRYKL